MFQAYLCASQIYILWVRLCAGTSPVHEQERDKQLLSQKMKSQQLNLLIKFIIIDKFKRWKGYGKEMPNLALQYAFHITGAESVQLNAFNENISAKQCYKYVVRVWSSQWFHAWMLSAERAVEEWGSFRGRIF